MISTRALVGALAGLIVAGGAAQAGPYEDAGLYQQAAQLFNERSYSAALPLLVKFSHICGNYEASNPGLCDAVDNAVAAARRAIERPVEAQSHYIAGGSGEGGSDLTIAQANEGPSINLPMALSCTNC